jgi:quinol-cytochrome oxidoreductase complex cytochrome b subunit
MKKQAENSKQSPEKRGLSYWLKDQFALAPLIGDYFIPGETNNLWYSLGGILAFALLMQGISGIILAFKYIPDAARAYGIMSDMIQSGWWSAIVAFHYYN